MGVSIATIITMGDNITTIDFLRVLIIEIGSTIILMVVEAQGSHMFYVHRIYNIYMFIIVYTYTYLMVQNPIRLHESGVC